MKMKCIKNQNEYCDICNAVMIIEVHCKLRCTNCGYTRDCSDP